MSQVQLVMLIADVLQARVTVPASDSVQGRELLDALVKIVQVQNREVVEALVNAREPVMPRPFAVALAKRFAVAESKKQGVHSYLQLADHDEWAPHNWVIEALQASGGAQQEAVTTLVGLGYVYRDDGTWALPRQPMERNYRELGEASPWLNTVDPEGHDTQDESYLATDSNDGEPIVGLDRVELLLRRLEETVRHKTVLEEQHQGKGWPDRAAYWHDFYRDIKIPKLREAIGRETNDKLDPTLVRLIRGDLKNTIDSNLNTTQILNSQLSALRKSVDEKETFHRKLSQEIALARVWLAANPEEPKAEDTPEEDPWG